MAFRVLNDKKIEDVCIIFNKRFDDNRGWFSELYKKSVLEDSGLEIDISQINNSYSKKKGTLRGLHLQLPPMEQGKLVYCVKGSIYDVAVDVRISSQTFGKWVGYEINSRENKAIWIPPGFAHGFQTLEDDTEIIYLTTGEYSQKLERSIAWNDEEINIEWPISNLIISEKDSNSALLKDLKIEL